MASRVGDSGWLVGSTPIDASARRLPLGLGRLGDERLAGLVASGRQRAFAVLYERYHKPLYRYCLALLRNETDAQDVLQSTFASALAALQVGRRNAPLRPWLFRIAHNESITLLRRRRTDEHELSEAMLPPVASAADQADERARIALLVADLAELPERQRGALLMRELNGLPHADIAVALGTSVGAAKQAIFDARTSLLEFAEGRAVACEEVRRTISERDGRALRGRRLRSHLRDCSSCAAFAAAISERRLDLKAIAPLPPAAASAALLAHLARSAPWHGAGSGAGAAGTAGAVGNLGGTALVSKVAVGAALVAAAAGGVGALPKLAPLDAGSNRPAPTHAHTPRAMSHPTRVIHAAPAGVRATGASRASVAVPRSPSRPRPHRYATRTALPSRHQPGPSAARSHNGGRATVWHLRVRSGPGTAPGAASPSNAATDLHTGAAHEPNGVANGQRGVSHHGPRTSAPGRVDVNAPHAGQHTPERLAGQHSPERLKAPLGAGRDRPSAGKHATSPQRAHGSGSMGKGPAHVVPMGHSGMSATRKTKASEGRPKTTVTPISHTTAGASSPASRRSGRN
jgi:RNA polymerase sigma factor (sigma-70 family)